MAASDPRYISLRLLIKHGDVTTVEDIFRYIPKTVIAQDLHHSNERITRMSEDPGSWELQDIYKLAQLIGYDPVKLSSLIAADYRRLKEK